MVILRSGKRYLAHRTPQMDWTCALTVKARESWAEWRNLVIGMLHTSRTGLDPE